MGNDWTRLTQEAGELGGPDALREYYRTQGQKSVVVYCVAGAASMVVAYGVNKYRKHADDKMMGRRILEATGTPAEIKQGTKAEPEGFAFSELEPEPNR